MRKYLSIMLALVGAGWAPPAPAQDETKPVEAVELVRSPQKYWARSFVFADTLRALPSGGLVKLDNRRYASFSTAVAGQCYVAAELVNLFNGLPLDRRYQFLGTVIQYGRRFYIIVRGVSASMEASELKLDWPDADGAASDYMKNQALRPIVDILTLAESAHVAYAEEKGVALEELYDPQSPHYGQALGLLRTTIMAHEQKVKMTASEMLAEYLFQMLAARHPAAARPAQPVEPPAAPETPAAPPAVEAPAPEPASTSVDTPREEPPKPLTRAERRELARQKKAEAAAARAEQKRQAAEAKKAAAAPAPKMPPTSAPEAETPAILDPTVEAARLEIPAPPIEAPAAEALPETTTP
ncbi:MAG TPA: hypothetical protein P5567_04495 [Kiritimatiellia bacterium]|nr:hypothetical protein [Kiritimatiellia bacterium]HRZ11698.1 hypothetical protein [Kiritimatiellia bacterium]HSA16751.1 hypothetical protein [Kiritimatiellia bacterium]